MLIIEPAWLGDANHHILYGSGKLQGQFVWESWPGEFLNPLAQA